MAGEFTPQVKALIAEREAYCCGLCGRHLTTQPWSYQHRRARGMGGSKDALTGAVVNGVLMDGDGVRGCHGYVESHPTWANLMGYRVPQGADPSLVPIWVARAGWVMLEADGSYLPCEDPHPEETRTLELVSAALLDLDRA